MYRCLNHVKDDIKKKLGTIAGHNTEKRKKCSDQFTQESKLNYLELLTEIQSEWNPQFMTNYNKNIRPDIDQIGAWACHNMGFLN